MFKLVIYFDTSKPNLIDLVNKAVDKVLRKEDPIGYKHYSTKLQMVPEEERREVMIASGHHVKGAE